MGYGLITGGLGGIYYDKLGGIFISVIASPLLSIGLAMALFFLFRKLFGKISESGRSTDNIMRFLLIFALCFSAYAFGANDVANATGVFATATESISGLSSTTSMRLLALFAAVGIAVGGFTLGKRVIDTGARRITKLSLLTGVSAGFSNAVTVYLFTTIPTLLFGWGVPVSTTHCSMGAIIGVGIAQGRESVDKRTVGKIILYWVITFPCVALLSAGLFKLAMLI
jgi:PiT family inorganic phosphate transporter